MTSRKTVRKIRTTAGVRYITGRLVDGEFKPSYLGKQYKTKKTAERAIR